MRNERIRSKKFLIAASLVLIFAASAYWAVPQTLVFCVLPVNPWEHVSSYTVYVTPSLQNQYKAEITEFLSERGVYSVSGEMRLSEPDSSKFYQSIQTLGCNGSVSVWSQNDVHPGEFMVTFNKNIFLGAQKAVALSRDFASAFGKHYRVLNTTDWGALDSERKRLQNHRP